MNPELALQNLFIEFTSVKIKKIQDGLKRMEVGKQKVRSW
jgi:hypothetical protein